MVPIALQNIWMLSIRIPTVKQIMSIDHWEYMGSTMKKVHKCNGKLGLNEQDLMHAVLVNKDLALDHNLSFNVDIFFE